VSQHQVGLLVARFENLDLDPNLIDRDRTVPVSQLGGFLVLYAKRAVEICGRLKEHGVVTDARGSSLRLGPAPYLSDRQLGEAMQILGEVIRALA